MRKSQIRRKTNETEILCKFNPDGSGIFKINTGIGFFDHMLGLMVFHGKIDMEISAKGDLCIDDHHTVEDTGIVIGTALNTIVENDNYINRFGYAVIPMDEVLCRTVIDISGRSFCRVNAFFKRSTINGFSTECVNEFFLALTREAKISLHIDILKRGNTHHEIEAVFKSFGIALKNSLIKSDMKNPISTKQIQEK